MGRYFGTDGIRGIAGEDLTPQLAMAAAMAGVRVLSGCGREVILGMDTRESSCMLSSAVEAGLAAAGADCLSAGVIPTPGVAYLTAQRGAAAGIVISASHNPYRDNGIKFFGPDGQKLPDATENLIEVEMGKRTSGFGMESFTPGRIGAIVDYTEGQAVYEDFIVSTCPQGLKGKKVLLDCSNGAAFGIAPAVFRRLGAEVIAMCDKPDGRNINEGCGATKPAAMAEATRRAGADMGFAFDGDADRCIMADEAGKILDGDFEMAILAKRMKADGCLGGGHVVATAYSNMGFAEALSSMGLGQLTADNGDRYVLQLMKENGLNLGGEQSGHILMLDLSTTGDGLLTAVRLASTVAASGRKASEVASVMRKYPQGQKAVKVARKADLQEDPEIRSTILSAEKLLKGKGRIFVRASGTEPVVRVMVEAIEESLVKSILDEVSAVVAKRLS